MTTVGLRDMVAKSVAIALVGGAVILGGAATAQAQQVYAGVQFGQPYQGNYGAYPYYGNGYGEAEGYGEQRERYLEHEQHEAWERQQEYMRHEHWEHERWEHARRFGDDDDEDGEGGYRGGYGYDH